jgi:hypothetical protein
MNYPLKIWDFFWGALITGTLAVIAFWFIWVLAGLAVGPLGVLLAPIAGVVTLLRAYHWRKHHRILPPGMIYFEVLFGLVIGVYFSVIMCRGFANLPP